MLCIERMFVFLDPIPFRSLVWIASSCLLAMTQPCHCEEERRSNPWRSSLS